MSDERKPPSDVVIDLRPAPQLTRATVRGNGIAFEIQVPDTALAPEYAESLENKFRYHFRTTQLGDYSKDPCPVDVRLDEVDKSQIIATYRLDGRQNHAIGGEMDRAVESFKDVQVRAGGVEHEKIRMTDKVAAGIRRAFDVLERLSPQAHGSAVATELARRGPRNEHGDRGPR